jgi:hypothetical protein
MSGRTMIRMLARPPAAGLVAAAALVSCMDEVDITSDDEIGSVTAELRRNPIDPPLPAGPASTVMFSGHQTKVPVSSFITNQWRIGTSSASHSFEVMTCNCSGDTGLLVRASNTSSGAWIATRYNDDGNTGCTGGTSPEKGSRLAFTGTVPTSYDVYAFSQDRATAYCSIWYRQNGGAWTFWRADHIGGALVDVGAMATDATLEVRTPNNGLTGPAIDDTRMVMFNLPGTSLSPTATHSSTVDLLASDNRAPTDRDPAIAIASSANPAVWSTGSTFTLDGKKDRATTSAEAVETFVDLVRGPINQGQSSLTIPYNGGASSSLTLAPGRYALWVNAWTLRPPGSTFTHYNRTDTDALGDNDCASSIDYDRGELNGPGLTLTVERFTPVLNLWIATPLSTGNLLRKVPRGAFGMDFDNQRFAVEISVPTAGTYRIRAASLGEGIFLDTTAHVVKNADSTEIKVASANLLYNDPGGDGSSNEYKNASNLMATRGSVLASTMQVEEREDQAPYQWQADVVALTENRTRAYFHDFVNEAQTRGALAWDFVYGQNEGGDWSETFGDWGRGALLVSENLWPSNGASIRFVGNALGGTSECTSPDFQHLCAGNLDCAPGCVVPHPSCTTGCTLAGDNYYCSEDDPRYQHCYIADNGDDAIWKWIIPGRLSVRRAGSTARPIAVIQLHLHSKGGSGQDDRLVEMREIARRIEELMDQSCPGCGNNARSFNKDGIDDPQAAGNRILLVGDFNVYAHGCGEHYWLLREMRSRFGFAVDAAMAAEGGDEWSFGMHDWGAASGDDAVNPVTGLPEPYVNRNTWGALALTHMNKWLNEKKAAAMPFPWWSRTFRSETACPGYQGDRHDMIMLVGRGWASDDPVVSYTVMQDSNKPSPFAVLNDDGTVRGGVEMFEWNSTACTPGDVKGGVPDSGTNYSPNYDVGAGTGPGRAALITDHRPIAARLRIFTPGDAGDR